MRHRRLFLTILMACILTIGCGPTVAFGAEAPVGMGTELSPFAPGAVDEAGAADDADAADKADAANTAGAVDEAGAANEADAADKADAADTAGASDETGAGTEDRNDEGDAAYDDSDPEDVPLEAAATTTSGNWIYTLGDNGLTLNGYTGAEPDVVIPDTIDGYKVSNIGAQAFYNNYSMQSVTIPAGVTRIGAEAFRGCIALNTIYFNAKNCTVPSPWIYDGNRGVGVFSGAGSAALSLTVVFGPDIAKVPDALFYTASIGEYGIKGYDYAHITAIEFSSSIMEIGSSAFRNCDALESVTLGSGIQTIGANAFNDCDGMTRLQMNDCLQTIKEGAFRSCDGLETIQWGNGIDTIERSAFEECTGLLEAVIPSPARVIGIRAFANCYSLSTLVLPESMNTLSGEAFAGTIKLSSLTINSTNLTAASPWIYDDNRGAGVFSGAGSAVTSLEVFFGDGVTNVPANLFYTASIGEYGIKGYDYAHVTSVWFADSVATIGENAFNNCDDLSSVTTGAGITTIGAKAFRDSDGLSSLTLNDALHTIGESAFYSCDGLETITWGSGLDEIGTSAFESCTSLKEVAAPVPLRVIGIRAFANCSSATTVILPESLNELRGEAFVDTTRLSSLIVYSTNLAVAPPWIYDSARGIGVFSGAGSGVSDLAVTFAEGVTAVPANMFYTASTDEYGLKGYDYAHVVSVTFETPIADIGRSAFPTTKDLKDIYYPGNAEKWEIKTRIEEGNEYLTNAALHFGSTLPHDLTLIKAKKATTKKDGNQVCYKCQDCGRCFIDADGTTDITDDNRILPAASNISLSSDTFKYTGNVRKPKVSVQDRNGKTIGKEEYTLSWSDKSSKNAGEYSVTVKFSSDRYAGSAKLTYTITPASITKATVTGIKNKTYTGKAITQKVTVKSGDKTLKQNTDYKVTYKNNTNVGTATVTIKGIGNYTKTLKNTFKINPKSTTISSLKASAGAFTAAWKKQATQTDGYQIQYSQSSSFKSAKTKNIKKTGTLKTTIENLGANKKYYVRMRTFKKVNGTNYYSSWSTAKSVKTK